MKLNKTILAILICHLAMTSCKKENFVDENIDPNVLYGVDPADQFLAAAAGSQDDLNITMTSIVT